MKQENKYPVMLLSGFALVIGMIAIGIGLTAAVAFGFSLYLALDALS